MEWFKNPIKYLGLLLLAQNHFRIGSVSSNHFVMHDSHNFGSEWIIRSRLITHLVDAHNSIHILLYFDLKKVSKDSMKSGRSGPGFH